MSEDWLIRNGRVIDPVTGRDAVRDIAIRDGRFVAIDAPAGSAVMDCPVSGRVVEAAGLLVLPAFVDIHVHFREPGDPAAETSETGARAAARGGFTRVLAMPNTRPPLDRPERLAAATAAARGAAVRIDHAACLTRDRAGAAPAELAALAAAGAAAFTDDGSTVPDTAVLRRVMTAARGLGLPVLDHALDPALAGAGILHAGDTAGRLGLPGIPAEAETRCVARDIALCRETGCPIHLQHLSAAGAVDLVRAARADGLPVTAEATPHHLMLTDADVTPHNTAAKINPPLRTADDRRALVAGVCDGTIQALATDHAPHSAEAKARGLRDAPFGAVGLETAVGVTYTVLVASGALSVLDWARRWTTGPAAVMGWPAPGFRAGQPADLLLVDPARSWTVCPETFASRARNTPFAGRTLTGRPVLTLRAGRPIWHDACIDIGGEL
jgi:dihydroorotase